MQFSVFIRRHHCRFCGQLFCSNCTKDRWSLPRFEYLQPARVCRKCSKLCWKAEALLLAITNKDVSAVSKFVAMQNDCMLHTGIYPPIVVAATSGASEIARILLSGGAKVNYAVPAPHNMEFVTCCFCGMTHAVNVGTTRYKCARCGEATRAISDKEKGLGQDASSKQGVQLFPSSDHIGLTALHAAVRFKGHADVVRALIASGADLNARTLYGNTALHLAASNGHLDCCSLLVECNAHVNARCDADGDRPLHRAVRYGHAAVVALLVQHGALKSGERAV